MPGPIEFMGERPDRSTPASEYGGVDGLIQPLPHAMTASEANNAVARAAMSGAPAKGDGITDPLTGRVVPPELNVKG